MDMEDSLTDTVIKKGQGLIEDKVNGLLGKTNEAKGNTLNTLIKKGQGLVANKVKGLIGGGTNDAKGKFVDMLIHKGQELVEGKVKGALGQTSEEQGNALNTVLKKGQKLVVNKVKGLLGQNNETEGDTPDADGTVGTDGASLKQKAVKSGVRYFASIFQMDELGGSQMSNAVLKSIVTFFLYLSYALLGIAVLIIVSQGADQRQQLIDYVKQQNNLPFIVALVAIAIIVIVMYEQYTKNQALEPSTRKFLNCAIDWTRVLFHAVFLVFIQGFVFNQPKKPIEIAFWALVIGDVFLVLRSLLKWVHYYCGSGTQNMKNWQKPFKFNEQEFKNHVQMISKLKDNIETIVDKKKGGKGKAKPTTIEPAATVQPAVEAETTQVLVATKS